MMWSSISDMGNYLQVLVNDGVYKGDTLLTLPTFQYLFRPHTLIPSNEFYPTQRLTNPNWMSYGLGWFQHDYRGEKLDFHTGSISWLISIAGIIHEKNTAVYVFSNLDHAELRHAILYKAMDLYAFGDEGRDWHSEVFDLYSGFREMNRQALETRNLSKILDTKPSVSLTSFEGIYTHEMLGKVEVTVENNELKINFNDYRLYQAKHWHYNTFRTKKDPKFRDSFLINFKLNATGRIHSLNAFGEIFTKK